jgi:hypothetical protein
MLRDTGTVPMDGAEDELPKFVPHPASSESNMAAMKKKNIAFRILDLLDVRN